MQELPRKSSLRARVWCAERMTLFWMRKLSRRNSTGKSLFALIPPTFAAARTAASGLDCSKKFSTAHLSLRSSCDRSRVSRFVKFSVSSRRTSALPTIPRWPATKILSDFFNCTVVCSQKIAGRQGTAEAHFVVRFEHALRDVAESLSRGDSELIRMGRRGYNLPMEVVLMLDPCCVLRSRAGIGVGVAGAIRRR